jgi:hypothetical protein
MILGFGLTSVSRLERILPSMSLAQMCFLLNAMSIEGLTPSSPIPKEDKRDILLGRVSREFFTKLPIGSNFQPDRQEPVDLLLLGIPTKIL